MAQDQKTVYKKARLPIYLPYVDREGRRGGGNVPLLKVFAKYLKNSLTDRQQTETW